MKIHIISDLHLEFGSGDTIDMNCSDLLIIAGDLHTKTNGLKWLNDNIEIPCIYVLGNHEYYKTSYPKNINKIKELANNNIHVLENESIVIDNITFHGTTLWTDFMLFGSNKQMSCMLECEENMNDYKKIRKDPSYSKLKANDTYRIHKKSLEWLDESLSNSKTNKNVVITHHAPSIKSIPSKYLDDLTSSAYASNLEDFIVKHNPNYWIHGHIHEPIEYMINDCEVICNPHGYISDEYNGYDKNLIIDV